MRHGPEGSPPLGEGWCTPHNTVPVPPRGPQGASLMSLPPSVFQGSVGSMERATQLPPGNGTARVCSFPPGEVSLEGLAPPCQSKTLATPEASLERPSGVTAAEDAM
ncbi:hypothetical protein Q8A67_008119 [Cirrhinus molitorella]|uniref:Uncharacterized protein n=1 Tax=Cirrhinus molitorella TaxID=172907 RepID=A0AA88Q1D8_9TELE|nr:hypothetical protein Q8A67_008119 [Cirrhinus molitorella]